MTLLLQYGAKLDQNRAGDASILAHLLSNEQNRKLSGFNERFEILLKAGARHASTDGKRFLHRAVELNDSELVALALKYGEKTDDDSDPEPPLWKAVQKNNSKIVEQLLNAGADPNRNITSLPGPLDPGTIYASAKRFDPQPTQSTAGSERQKISHPSRS